MGSAEEDRIKPLRDKSGMTGVGVWDGEEVGWAADGTQGGIVTGAATDPITCGGGISPKGTPGPALNQSGIGNYTCPTTHTHQKNKKQKKHGAID